MPAIELTDTKQAEPVRPARRVRILLPALLVEALAAVLFLVWASLPGLIVARLLTGLGVGMITATATAHLAELHAVARPQASPVRPGVMAVAALGVSAVPETVVPDGRPCRAQRITVPPADRTRYVDAAAGAFGLFAVMGLFTSLAPSFLRSVGQSSPLVGGYAGLVVPVLGIGIANAAGVPLATSFLGFAVGDLAVLAGVVPAPTQRASARAPAGTVPAR